MTVPRCRQAHGRNQSVLASASSALGGMAEKLRTRGRGILRDERQRGEIRELVSLTRCALSCVA